MKPKLECVVDNTVKKWMKDGLLHREDGPAVIKGSGANQIEEYWFEGCLVTAAMLELHKTLTTEINDIVKNRKVSKLERTESPKVRFKALNGDTLTEMRVENGKTLMYVYDRSGKLLDVLEEITSYIPPKPEVQTK